MFAQNVQEVTQYLRVFGDINIMNVEFNRNTSVIIAHIKQNTKTV